MFVQPFLWFTAVTCVRMSCLLLYHYLFVGRIFRFFNSIDIILNICFWLATILSTALICQPPEKLWRPETPGRCGSEVTWHLFTSISQLILDFFVVMRPMPVLWQLPLPWKQRVMLTGMFGMGIGSVSQFCPYVPPLLHEATMKWR